jgi:hypothetical protein
MYAARVGMQGESLPFLDILDKALARKGEFGTWKAWIWPATGDAFPRQSDFRKFVIQQMEMASPDTALNLLLDYDQSGKQDTEAEGRFRERMIALRKEVQEALKLHTDRMNGVTVRNGRKVANRRVRLPTDEIVSATKEFHIDMIVKMMGALGKEHELFYQYVAQPIAHYLISLMPDDMTDIRTVRSPLLFGMLFTALQLQQAFI